MAENRRPNTRWVRGAPAMEPEDAAAAIAAGASWVVGWCGVHVAPYRLTATMPALRDAQAAAVGAEENARQLRKGRTKKRWATIVIAEEWLDREGKPADLLPRGPAV